MPISHKYKCIFVHITKNAGTSITNEFEMTDIGHYPWHIIRDKYPMEWLTYFKFTIVRDPYDRFISSYEYSKMEKSYWHSSGDSRQGKHTEYDLLKDRSFGECVKLFSTQRNKFQNHCWTLQCPYVLSPDGDIMVDYIVRFENLEEDMKYVYKVCGKEPQGRKDNPSQRKEENYYDEETKKIVSGVYSRDFRLFNYPV